LQVRGHVLAAFPVLPDSWPDRARKSHAEKGNTEERCGDGELAERITRALTGPGGSDQGGPLRPS